MHRSLGAFVSSICAHPACGVSEASMNAMTNSCEFRLTPRLFT